jgi:DNA-binding transcriptional LysR family regulator
MYTLDQLRGFVAVADELHFGRAAQRLNLTQPALTRQIQKLERTIGVQLFERDRRGVALTAAGAAFVAEARNLLSLADAAPDLARRISAGAEGVLRVGFTASSTLSVLGELLNRVSVTLPRVSIELDELVTIDQLAALERGGIDLGIGRPPFDSRVFDSLLLHTEPMVVAVPDGHRLTERCGPITAEDLRNEDLIMHSPTQARYFYDLAVSIVPTASVRFVHTVTQILTMVTLVGANRGIALVPASATRLALGGVAYLELEEAIRKPAELHAIWLRDSPNPVLGRAVNIFTRFSAKRDGG